MHGKQGKGEGAVVVHDRARNTASSSSLVWFTASGCSLVSSLKQLQARSNLQLQAGPVHSFELRTRPAQFTRISTAISWAWHGLQLSVLASTLSSAFYCGQQQPAGKREKKQAPWPSSASSFQLEQLIAGAAFSPAYSWKLTAGTAARRAVPAARRAVPAACRAVPAVSGDGQGREQAPWSSSASGLGS
jgi:hypothetical protein